MSAMLESTAPATGETLGRLEGVDASSVDALVARARSAQPAWEKVGPAGRAMKIAAFGRAVGERAEELSQLVAAEVGKPIVEARAEVARVGQICTYYGGVGFELGGTLRRSLDPQVTIMARSVPVGVAGVITPWNFPVAIPAWKIVPALVSGCSVAWKPASQAVLSAELLLGIAHEAGIPDDVWVGVFGNAAAGSALANADIDALSFTGSTSVGDSLRAELGGRRRPRLTLELGGVNIAHVLADADISQTAAALANGAYGFAGQKCTATQIIAVDPSIREPLTESVVDEMRKLAVGDPLDESVAVGPVIDEETAMRLGSEVEALESSHRVIERREIPDAGAFVAPTLLEAGPDTALARGELFGPIAAIVEVDGLEDRARLAETSGLGLTAAIYSNDFDQVRRLLNVVGTGVVAVNRPSTGLDPHVPFGGWRDSGGDFAEQGTEGLRFFLKSQTVYWRGADLETAYP